MYIKPKSTYELKDKKMCNFNDAEVQLSFRVIENKAHGMKVCSHITVYHNCNFLSCILVGPLFTRFFFNCSLVKIALLRRIESYKK